jgi:hypothetical protein|nr:MAG TPA: hypothetical protein [Caudoviricetes sp.]
MAADWVRVRHAVTRHEYTVDRAEAEANKDLEFLEKGGCDINGRPLPMKPRIDLAPAGGDAPSDTPIPPPAYKALEKGSDQ